MAAVRRGLDENGMTEERQCKSVAMLFRSE